MKYLRSITVALLCLVAYSAVYAQQTDAYLANLLQQSAALQTVLQQPEAYDVQIIYTQINRNGNNKPRFKTYKFNVNPQRYFYPASTVKLPAVLVALEKLEELPVKIGKETPFFVESAFTGHEAAYRDSTSATGWPSIDHYSRKILLVSDNDAYNRLYDFMGQQYFNERLHRKGLTDTRLTHRLDIFYTPDENKRTPAVWFGKPRVPNPTDTSQFERLYQQPPQYTPQADYLGKTPVLRGTGYIAGGKLVKEPFNFQTKNNYPLTDQHALLKALMFPQSVAKKQRFNLSKQHYDFVYKYMSMFPREADFPKYDTTNYYDGYVKYFMFGDSKQPIPKNIRIFNKVGSAYGYLIDNAYIVDFDKGVEFMLSAVILGNSDGVFNDSKYDYETVTIPFLAELGRTIYQYEVGRKKKNLPDLSRFKLSY